MTRFALFSIALIAAASAISTAATADEEVANAVFTATDEHRRCFARSIPLKAYGTAGATDVYAVGEPPTLIERYDWYAPRLFIACNVADGEGRAGPALVQIGPWPRGGAPDEETLALAFHYAGEEVGRHSTLEIANGDPENASCSVSHYTVIHEIEGFARDAESGETVFRLKTVDGRSLTFSAATGALLDVKQSPTRKELRGVCSP